MNLDRDVADDLKALKRATAMPEPDIEETARALRSQSRRGTQEGRIVNRSPVSRLNPGFAAAAAVAVVVLALLLVPISYNRTVGYEVRLALPGATVANAPVVDIARQLKGLLGADGVSVSSSASSGGGETTLLAKVGHRAPAEVQAAADGFARALTAKGVRATAQVRPVVEHAVGSVCAMAAERLREIRIQGQGKSPAQIEQEIATRLAQVGFVNPEVKVTREGNTTRIDIKADDAKKGSGSGAVKVTVDGIQSGK